MDITHANSLAALSAELAAAVKTIGASVAYVDAHPHRDASGIVWDEHHVVTVDHAIEREDDVPLLLADGATAQASVVGRDPSTDVALLHTTATLVPARRASAGDLAVGHLVLAVGRDEDGAPGASFGVVSSLDGPWRTWRGGNVERFVRPDVNVYPGFSGGPLVDVSGAVIGMNTWGLSRRTALTLPVATLERVAAELMQTGRVARGYLGIAMQSVRLPERLQDAGGLRQASGALVVDVAAGGPAERAGLFIGDVLIALGPQAVEDSDDVQRALESLAVGTTATAGVLRGGVRHDVHVTIGERSSDGD